MPTLSSTIVKHQIASMRDVEEALARQVLYGGDLATNLLELASVSEQALTGVLAESHELEAGPIGELPVAAEATRRLVPGEIALRHGFYPLEEQSGKLVVAVSEPLVPEVEEDLCFALGVRIVQRAVPLVRIRQALARDYTVPLDRRTLRILAKLEGRPDPSPSSLPGPVHASAAIPALPRPPSIPPFGVQPMFAAPEFVATAPAAPLPTPEKAPAPRPVTAPETVQKPTAAETVPKAATAEVRSSPVAASLVPASRALRSLARAESRPPKSRPRRHGPYTAAMAERDLLQATSRDDVLRAFFDFALQYFEYAALFAVHGDLAEGRDANGPGADRARVNGIGVPLDLPSALASAKKEGTWQLVRLSSDGIDAALAKDLQRPAGRMILLLPVVVRDRCVLILYGDHGSNDVELATIGELIAFASLIAVSLERVIVKKKLMARGDEGAGAPDDAILARAGRSRAPKPDLKERAMALARALELPRSSSHPPPATGSKAPAPTTEPIPKIAEAPPTAVAPTPSRQPRARAGTERLPRPRTEPLLSPPPKPASMSRPAQAEPLASALRRAVVTVGDSAPLPGDKSLSAPAHPVISIGGEPRRVTPAQGTPRAIGGETGEETVPIPLTRRSSPAHRLTAETDEAGRPSAAPVSAKPISRKQTLIGGSERTPTGGSGVDSSPEIAIGTATLDADIDELLRASEPPLPSSRSVVHHSHKLRPRRSSDEMKLPTVIVDLASDCRELVRRLLRGDNEAAEKLAEIGGPAVSELVAAFPGPILRELRRGVGDGPPRASDCGPLLRTLARIGAEAAPFLIVRTADTDPKVRAWATRLLGELPTVEGGRAVAKRLADTDVDVRRAALAAGRMMQGDPETRGALREELCEASSALGQPSEVRQAALEALSDLRDPRAVPRLVRLLNDKDSGIAKSALWALITITRQDFARDAVRWTAWWEQNANMHRIEWLIDALMHDDAEIRRAAGDELKALTKEYFGYYDDLPRKERARAQSRYREWWDTKGKPRFGKG